MPRRRRNRAVGSVVPWMPALAVACLAATVFGLATGTYPVAGVSAQLLDKHLWLDGLPLATNPVWGMIVRGLVRLVPVAPVAALNLFGAACGVAAVGLFYYLNARLLELLNPGRPPVAYVLCGVSAALYLVVSPPFWMLCTRAHPLSFDVFLLLLAIFLQSEYQRTRQIRFLFGCGFVYGIGLVEYPAFVVLAWPLGVLTLLLMRKRGHLRRSKRRRNLVLGMGWSTAGVLVALVAAVWAMTRSPARLWMDDAGWLRMLRLLLAAEWGQLVQGFPRTGWMLIGMVTVVPWLVCLWETHRRSSLHDLPSLFVYLVLTGLTLTVLFNGPLAPSVVLGDTPPIVLPYFFAAGAFGLTVNYWRAAISRLWAGRRWPALWVRNGLIALLPACVAVAPVVTLPQVSPRPTRVLYDCAVEILDAMGERPWLVTDGSLDSLLRLAALETGNPLELVSLNDGFDPRYLRILATRFTDPRHRSLAAIGVLPLLRELLATDPAITDKLAFQNSGSLWLEAGFELVPERLIYGGRGRDEPPPDTGAVLDRHGLFWGRTVARLRRLEQTDLSHGPLARHLRWQVSRVANDLGVMMERAGDEAGAREAYRASRAANDLNASAIVNLAGTGEVDLPAAVRDELNLPIPLLVALHDHIHRLGDLLSLRGTNDVAAPEMPEAIRQRFEEVAVRYQSGDQRGCLDALAEILREEPANSLAWYLRGLLGVQCGDETAWEESWQFMSRQDRPWPAFLMIRGERLLKDGQTTDGLDLYEKALALSPYDPLVVRPVAMAEFAQGSPGHAEPYVIRLLSLDPSDPWGNFALGTIQFSRGEHELAESSLRVAVDRLKLPHAHNNLARLLTLRGRHDEARAQVEAALSLDPDFAPAWDTLGVILMQAEDLDRAATALGRALELDPQSWDTRVHHAQLALAAGRAGEATGAAVALEVDCAGKSSADLAEYRALRRSLGLPSFSALE